MKITISYEARTVEVYPNEIADADELSENCTDDDIRRAIRDNIAEADSQREWPAMHLRNGDIADLVSKVRQAIACRSRRVADHGDH